MIDYKAIGRRIAFYRKKERMTQATLSERLAVSESFVSQIERGSAKISFPRLWQIADILAVDVALLVSDRVCISETPCNSEIAEIIKDWPAEQIDLLIDLLTLAGDRIVPHNK